MIDLWWIAAQVLAGGLGAVARFGLMSIIRPGIWSWGLFAVNAAGSFIVGSAAGAFAADALDWSTVALVLAFAAGFTTFSTLTVTAAQHIERREIGIGSAIVTAHVVLGVVLAGVGYISASAAVAS